ncbi:MAG: NAD-dependent epimerase/dehydratase family protein [Deltaproteobacteria bacterium]|nr:NAD-dependent epimerase/dehydratase family protein [Deltaproteobacteria bacterium]
MNSSQQKRALVTGATGFVGNAVTRALLSQGKSVRILSRPQSNRELLKDLSVEVAWGDLRDIKSLQEALKGVDELYHVAAQYTFYNPKPQEIYASNVEGTRNILEAGDKAGVQKMVYTSTVGAIGIPLDGSPGTEESPLSLEDCSGHYKRSKFLAEEEALKLAQKGLPIVIVNPSAPVGPRDVKPTPTGKMILDFLKGKMPAYIETGLNLIDVDDCAQGHLLAAEKGKVGERYILGNQNLRLKEILELLAEITGLPAPKFQIPYPVAQMAAWFSEGWAKLSGSVPAIEKEAVQLAKKFMFFDAGKAVRELGLPQSSPRQALKKAVKWYLDHGYIPPKQVKKIKLKD